MTPERTADRQEILRKALSGIRTLRAELNALERDRSEPLAVVGLGCRFPGGADSPEAFWHLLHHGVDSISEVPADRWDVNAYYDAARDKPGKSYTRCGGFLREDVSLFDNDFFRISPREAMSLDPQQRLLLEVAWEAMERAGQARSTPDGAVFVGISTNDYAQHVMFCDPVAIDLYAATGNALNAAAGRLAFFLGFRGPAVAVDTACSSSLVAVHLACQSLRARECRLALAGGVNLMLTPHATIATCRAKMLAPDGRCKAFDASADGYVRGEGCALIALKRLSDAEADGDSILAVILGSAVNQDGASSALTVPNAEAQRALLRRALSNAKVQAADLDLIEAHGTGTPLGDPIEFDSLRDVFGEPRLNGSRCAIGSVKTNIGHLEAAAGIAGLVKVILALNHEEIPPHLHFRRLNPQISTEGTPFFIPTTPVPWLHGKRARIAGVSSFGFTGSNAHVVVRETPLRPTLANSPERSMHLLALSARDEMALHTLADRCAEDLETHSDRSIADVCFTANTGRPQHTFRLTVRGGNHEEITQRLRSSMTSSPPGVRRGEASRSRRPKVALLCTGQGAQFVGMGRQLYDEHPRFRRQLEQCSELVHSELGQPLTGVMFGSTQESGLLDRTQYTQPALFAFGCALADLYRGWGIEPTVVMGHSLGEYVAAYVAGVFGLADGLRLVMQRARLMMETPGLGKMVSVFAPATRVGEFLSGYERDISIAALNGPAQTVISGRAEALDQILRMLDLGGVRYQALQVSHAFHSPLMEPMLDEFEAISSQVPLAAPSRRLISNLTGSVVDAEEIQKSSYWRRHVREPVQFEQSIETIRKLGCDILVEIGPGTVLSSIGQSCSPGWGTWLPTIRRGRSDWDAILETLSELFVRGCEVDWRAFDADYHRHRVTLPTYPFQRKRFWPERTVDFSRSGSTGSLSHETGHPFLGRRRATPLKHLEFESDFSLNTIPIVADHRIYGAPWVNLVVYLEAALAAVASERRSAGVEIRELQVMQPLILPETGARTVRIMVTPQSDGEFAFQLFSFHPAGCSAHQGNGESFILHSSGTLVGRIEFDSARPSLEIAGNEFTQHMGPDEFYKTFFGSVVKLGPLCHRLDSVCMREGQALGRISPRSSPVPTTVLDLGAVDACLQLVASLFPDSRSRDWLITAVEGVRLYAPLHGHLSCIAARESFDAEEGRLTASLRLFDEQGRLLFEIKRAQLQRFGAEAEALREGLADRSVTTVCPTAPQLDALLSLPAEDREQVLEDYVVGELAAALGIAPDTLDRDVPLLGQIDSLIAAEFKTRVEASMNIAVPVAPFFDGSTVRQFSRVLLESLQNPVSPGTTEEEVFQEMLDSVEQLSEEQARTQVAKHVSAASAGKGSG